MSLTVSKNSSNGVFKEVTSTHSCSMQTLTTISVITLLCDYLFCKMCLRKVLDTLGKYGSIFKQLDDFG